MNTAKAKSVSAMTKAEMLAHFTAQVAALEARIVVGARMVKDLRNALAMAKQPALVYTQATTGAHKAYYGYVREQRATCKALGLRVTTFKTFSDWQAVSSVSGRVQ